MARELGDRAVGATIDFKFNTASPTDGSPITLAGTPTVAVYKDNSTTESTSGVTLTVDFDSRTGLHNVRITTASDGTFYAAASNFQVVLTAGTVGGVSQAGAVLADFTLGLRAAAITTASPIAANVTQWMGVAVTTSLETSATVAAAVWNEALAGHTTAGTTGLKLSGLTVPLDAAGTRSALGLTSANLDTQLGALSSGQTTITGRLPAALVSGRMDVSVGAMAANVITAAATAADFVTETQGAAAAALNAYDPPTSAEMDARTLVAASYATSSALSTVSSVLGAVKVVTDKVDTALELNAGTYRFTFAALENAPTGGLNAAGVRSAIGLATANLDTQLSGISTQNTTAKVILDKFNTMTELNGSVYRYTSASLVNSPTGSGGGSTPEQIWSYADRQLTSSGVTAITTGLATAANQTAIKAKTDLLSFNGTNVNANILQVINDPIKTNSTKTTNWGGT